MCKKLLVLFLVLGIVSTASATNYFKYTTNDWETAANWSIGAVPNYTNDATVQLFNNAISAARVVNINSAAIGKKVRSRYDDGYGQTLNLQTGSLTTWASLQFYGTNGSMDGGTSPISTFNIAADTTATVGTRDALGDGTLTTTYADYWFGGQGNNHTCNVDGTLNVQSADYAGLGASSIRFGSGKGAGAGAATVTLNIASTGLVDIDELEINAGNDATLTTLIDITTGGVMKVLMSEDGLNDLVRARRAGQLVGDGGANGVKIYDDGAGKAVAVVPEPATIALLGLGGLLLRKRR